MQLYITYFHCISVKDLMQLVVRWKMLVNKTREITPYIRFDQTLFGHWALLFLVTVERKRSAQCPKSAWSNPLYIKLQFLPTTIVHLKHTLV